MASVTLRTIKISIRKEIITDTMIFVFSEFLRSLPMNIVVVPLRLNSVTTINMPTIVNISVNIPYSCGLNMLSKIYFKIKLDNLIATVPMDIIPVYLITVLKKELSALPL